MNRAKKDKPTRLPGGMIDFTKPAPAEPWRIEQSKKAIAALERVYGRKIIGSHGSYCAFTPNGLAIADCLEGLVVMLEDCHAPPEAAKA